jgi:hypothetical protein
MGLWDEVINSPETVWHFATTRSNPRQFSQDREASRHMVKHPPPY